MWCPGGSTGRRSRSAARQGVGQGVDVGFVVVHVERGPGGGSDPQATHERLGAVVPGPHAHAPLVEHLGQVVGMHVL